MNVGQSSVINGAYNTSVDSKCC